MRPVGPVLLLMASALGSCGRGAPPQNMQNDAARQAEQLDNQARQLQSQAENSVSVIEQAMENEGRAIFENREILLNQALDAVNSIEPAQPPASGNRSR